jgi:hypothetical protein
MLRWRIPMPPSRAIAIAIPDSVTVSIAALASGIFSSILRENLVEVLTSDGIRFDSPG